MPQIPRFYFSIRLRISSWFLLSPFILFFLFFDPIENRSKISHLDRFIRASYAPTYTPKSRINRGANSWIGESLTRRGKNYSTIVERSYVMKIRNEAQSGIRGGDWPFEKKKIERRKDGGRGGDTEATGGDAAAF